MKLYKIYIVVLLLLSFCSASAQELVTLSGTINDDQGLPAVGATVFLANTHYASSADSKGHFIFKDCKAGSYQLIVQLIGFVTYTQNLDLRAETAVKIKLLPNNNQLKEVQVKAKFSSNRQEYLRMFIANFIGQLPNADKCTITNSNAIRFSYNKETGVLNANADSLLVIENKGLGYRLKYLLKQFEFDNRNRTVFYTGFPYFEELKGTEAETKEWQLNREIAYKGSLIHFLRAAYRHTAEAEGFGIYIPDNTLKAAVPTLRQVRSDSLTVPVGRNLAVLNPKYINVSAKDTTPIFVYYKGENSFNSLGFNSAFRLPSVLSSANAQLSKLKPLGASIFIRENGSTTPFFSFFISGYLLSEKIAEMLPLDYTIPDNYRSVYNSKLIVLENQ